MYTVRDQQYFVHNSDKFQCMIVIFYKQHRESNAKLCTGILQVLSTSPNQSMLLLYLGWLRSTVGS